MEYILSKQSGRRTTALEYTPHPSDLWDGRETPGTFEPHGEDDDQTMREVADDRRAIGTVADFDQYLEQEEPRAADFIVLGESRLSDCGDGLSRRSPELRFKEDFATDRDIYRPFSVRKFEQTPKGLRLRDYGETTASEWLRANDPERTAEGVTAEIAELLEPYGLALAEARGAFPSGRPNVEIRALRRVVSEALAPTYEDGRNRKLMAQALGCSRQALHSMMRANGKA